MDVLINFPDTKYLWRPLTPVWCIANGLCVYVFYSVQPKEVVLWEFAPFILLLTFKPVSFTHKISLQLWNLACLVLLEICFIAARFPLTLLHGDSDFNQHTRVYNIISLLWRMWVLVPWVGGGFVTSEKQRRGRKYEERTLCICREQASLVPLFLEKLNIISCPFP